MTQRHDISVDVPVRAVTLLEDRGRVTRRARLTLPRGDVRLRIADVAPTLVNKTLVATTDSGVARVREVRCHRQLARWQTSEGPGASKRSADVVTLQEKLKELVQRGAILAIEASTTERAIARLEELQVAMLSSLADEAAWGRAHSTSRARLEQMNTQLTQLGDSLLETNHAQDAVNEERTTVKQRLAEASDDAGTAEAALEIDLTVDTEGEYELTVSYAVPGALWRPYHTATLDGATLSLRTDACVWQHTGEDWHDAAMTFSTERPSLGSSPPRLTSDLLRTQKKQEQLEVEVREQEIVDAGLGMGAAKNVATQVPGVDDGGITQRLVSKHPATVLSDGKPWRIEISTQQSTATTALVCMPELSNTVLLRCRADNGPTPLLAGPIDLIRSHGYAGRTSTLYIAPGERFDLGFGPDPELRVHREQRRKYEKAGLLSSWNTTRVRVAVRISNLGQHEQTMEIVERVPVSEIEKVEIVVSKSEAWKLEDDDGKKTDLTPVITDRTIDGDGMVRWQVTVPGHGHRAVALEYTIRAHTSVVGLAGDDG